jgi:hypothetical protein
MPATYEPIATQTLGSATTSITFSSIPSTYTDLVIVIGSLGMNSAGSAGRMRFNGDTGSNYSNTTVWGNGSAAGSNRENSVTSMRIYGVQTGPAANLNNDNVILQIQNYSNSTTFKTALIRDSLTTETSAIVGLWRSTSAINSINIIILKITKNKHLYLNSHIFIHIYSHVTQIIIKLTLIYIGTHHSSYIPYMRYPII